MSVNIQGEVVAVFEDIKSRQYHKEFYWEELSNTREQSLVKNNDGEIIIRLNGVKYGMGVSEDFIFISYFDRVCAYVRVESTKPVYTINIHKIMGRYIPSQIECIDDDVFILVNGNDQCVIRVVNGELIDIIILQGNNNYLIQRNGILLAFRIIHCLDGIQSYAQNLSECIYSSTNDTRLISPLIDYDRCNHHYPGINNGKYHIHRIPPTTIIPVMEIIPFNHLLFYPTIQNSHLIVRVEDNFIYTLISIIPGDSLYKQCKDKLIFRTGGVLSNLEKKLFACVKYDVGDYM